MYAQISNRQWKIHFKQDHIQTKSLFPCGKTQHVRRMHSSIASVINSVFKFRCAHFLVIPHSRFPVTSVLFLSVKIATVTAYLLESPLARFKNFRMLFHNYCLFARVQIKNGNILYSFFLGACLFPLLWRKQKQKFTFSQNYPALVVHNKRNFAIIAADWNHQLVSLLFEVTHSTIWDVISAK